LVRELLEERFEVVLMSDSDSDSEIFNTCQYRQGTFTYYMKSMDIEHILRNHRIDSIIHMTDDKRSTESVDIFKFSKEYGVKNCIMMMKDEADEADVDTDATLNSNDSNDSIIASSSFEYMSSSLNSVESLADSLPAVDSSSSYEEDKHFSIIKYSEDDLDQVVIEMLLEKIEHLSDIDFE